MNQALATEIVCVLRYKRHFYSAKGLNKDAVAAEFLAHAGEEQGHADRIAERITHSAASPISIPRAWLRGATPNTSSPTI